MAEEKKSFFDFVTKDKKGQPYPLSQHRGQVVLVVNTASKCGYTPQLKSLESLYQQLGPSSTDTTNPPPFTILAFPCNQFLSQEPGSDESIQSFCQLNYGVHFPVLAKTEVNGDDAEPVFRWLKECKPGLMGLKRVKWNFEKFLVGRDGRVKARWASGTDPLSDGLVEAVKREMEVGIGEGES